MATGQTLLDTLEVVLPEMQLQVGEADTTRGLIALNRAQDMFETHAAQYGPDWFGSGVGSVTATVGVEYTAFPAGLMRLDGLDLIDAATSLPMQPLTPITMRGGHRYQGSWPRSLFLTSGQGSLSGYWTNGTRIYWSPLPASTQTVRWYGFQAADDISASGTFAYPDAAILPFATIAAKILKIGLDDSVAQLNELAVETFNALLDQLSGFNRDNPGDYAYSRGHDT